VNEEQKHAYLDKYKKEKAKGVKFYPDIIYKDLLVSFGIFLLLLGLATFIGVAPEPPADPSDATYIPRPEWYFLFLFEMLKFFPGAIEWIGTVVIPSIAVLALFLLPFYDRNPSRHWSKRRLAISIMSVIVVGMVALTIRAVATTPPNEEGEVATTLAEQILQGEELYNEWCVECHGADGDVTVIEGVEGLEGKAISPISSRDVMYTRTDETLFAIIDMGQQDLGMPPFGLGYGGEISRGGIFAIVNYMRYTWDDRAELPQEVVQAGAIPPLGPDEVPSYEVHVAPIFKRYCISCHRPGKKNQNYLMRDYNEVMTTGDHAPNIIPGDLNSNNILMINRQEIEAGGPMPPTKALKPELIDIITRWVAGGAPNTAADAAALSAPAASPVVTATLPIEPTPVSGLTPTP
jgi:mono/diheme cytochrome c family protein